MEQNEVIGLKLLEEIPAAACNDGNLAEEFHQQDAIVVVIHSENYRIEIEIG